MLTMIRDVSNEFKDDTLKLKNFVSLELPNKLQFFKTRCPSVTRILPSFLFGRLATAWLDTPTLFCQFDWDTP